MKKLLSAFWVFFLFLTPAWAESPVWDRPRPVNHHTVFFGEDERLDAGAATAARPDEQVPNLEDKSYPWYWMGKGNSFLLAGHLEKAAAAFENAYLVGGSTRVMSGFKLVETYETLGNLDRAIEIMDEMRKKYLLSSQEIQQADQVRTRLEDRKRKIEAVPPPPEFTGRLWLNYLSVERLRYVVDAMEELRRHRIPLKLTAQTYVFRLDEYFIAHPEVAAQNGPEILAGIVYENDADARVPIDRWRLDPEGTLLPTMDAHDAGRAQFTGHDWLVMTHEHKRRYVLQAMEVLRNQQVPMGRSSFAYEYAIDEFFTEKPELPAADSVVTLASILYTTEPEAREILEAIRLR